MPVFRRWWVEIVIGAARDHNIFRFQGNGVCLDLLQLMDECLNDFLIAGLITPWIR